MKRRPTDSNTEGKKDTGMLKYIRNQVIRFFITVIFIKGHVESFLSPFVWVQYGL